jgi:hypothetical protein
LHGRKSLIKMFSLENQAKALSLEYNLKFHKIIEYNERIRYGNVLLFDNGLFKLECCFGGRNMSKYYDLYKYVHIDRHQWCQIKYTPVK